MNDARDGFEQCREEIERYFEFLQPHLDPISTPPSSKLDTELQKILKAAAMLLLYNVLEASVRNGILAVYDSVNAAGIDYARASDGLRSAWLEQRLRVLDKASTKYDTFRDTAYELLDIAARSTALQFNVNPEEAIDFGGNVDARKIRDLASRHGISLTKELEEGRAFRLLEVKRLRNRLTHGFLSFADCGRDLDWSAMTDSKNQVIEYLRAWFDCLETFVQLLSPDTVPSTRLEAT